MRVRLCHQGGQSSDVSHFTNSAVPTLYGRLAATRTAPRTSWVARMAFSFNIRASAGMTLSRPGYALSISSKGGMQRASRSTATTRSAPSSNSARVRPPGPGPTSYVVAFASGPAARAIRRVRFKSGRKFWPSNFRAAAPCVAMTSPSGGSGSAAAIGQLRGESDGRKHAARIGLALSGNVQRGAVVGRGADDRQPQRNVHAFPESQCLHRDQRLVVIHAESGIVAGARTGMEHRVGGKRSKHVCASAAQRLHGRRNDLAFFAPKFTLFSSVGIETRDGQP